MSDKSKKDSSVQNEEQYDTITIGGADYKTHFTNNYKNTPPYQKHSPRKLTAFIPGTIFDIKVKKGSKVEKDEVLLILEAMKMRNEITAPFDGKVSKVHVKKGEIVAKDALLIELE